MILNVRCQSCYSFDVLIYRASLHSDGTIAVHLCNSVKPPLFFLGIGPSQMVLSTLSNFVPGAAV